MVRPGLRVVPARDVPGRGGRRQAGSATAAQYQHRDGTPSTVAAYVGDDTLIASIRRLVTAHRTIVGVQVESLQLPGTDRRDLAARCEAAVRGDTDRRARGHALVA
jgi:hypothetical protein